MTPDQCVLLLWQLEVKADTLDISNTSGTCCVSHITLITLAARFHADLVPHHALPMKRAMLQVSEPAAAYLVSDWENVSFYMV